MRSAVWSARHWNDEFTAEPASNPLFRACPFPSGKTPCTVRVWIVVPGSNTKEVKGPRRARRVGIAPRAPISPPANKTLCTLRPRPSGPVSAPSWKLNLPPSQNQNPATLHRPIPGRPHNRNAFRDEKTSCALRPRPSSHASATPWKLSLPPSQNQNPASRHRPISGRPHDRSAFRNEKTSCALRPRPSSPGSAPSWKLSPPPSKDRRSASRHRPISPPCDRSAFRDERTSCALRPSGRSPCSATSRKPNLPPSQNQRSADKHRPIRHARAAEARIPVEEPYAPRETAYPKPEARTRPRPDTIALPTRGAGLETGGRMVR